MNTVRANITSSRYAETNSIFQYDTGRKLEIYGCNLPKSVEVQFSTDKEKGNTITRVGNTNNGVTTTIIPNQLLNDSEKTSNFCIFAFLYNVDNDGGRTEYVIKIPVVARPKPENPSEEPLPEPNIFHETVEAVNAAADRAEQAEQNAKASETEAGKYASSASESAAVVEKTKEDALKEVGEKKQEAIEAIQNQTADSKAGLEQTIKNADTSKKELDESIQTAGDTKTALDKSVELAGIAKTELDTSTQKAGEARTALDGSARTAGEMQETLSATVKQAGALDTSLGEKIETGTQLKKDLTASGEKAVQDIQTAGSEQLGKIQAVAEEFTADREQITTNKEDIGSLKEDIYTQVEKTFSTNDDFDWQSGWFETDGTVHEHKYFKHSKIMETVPNTEITFTNLCAPENYIACIACFSGAEYVHDVSLKGEAYVAFSSGTFTVPENIDGVSFISYVDGANEITVKLTTVEAKSDLQEEKIENIENNIQHMEPDIAENYNQIYNVKKYTITDGIDIKGSYYDKNGKLQLADNLSTTGIFAIPYGIKSIEYTAYRSVDIPTILFFNASMEVAGMVIATTEPVYGDTMYSGTAKIPSDAVHMEFSVNNADNDSSVTVIFSNIESNQKRIEILEKDPLVGLKITCTGNSITAATHSVPGHGYVEQIADAHGMTVDNHAIWGAIIPQGHPRANGDITDIGCIHDTLDSMDADADIVIMSGSINDCEYYSDASFLGEITGDFSIELDLTTFYGALEDMCKKALQKWAGKPIIYVIEHRMTLDNTTYGQYYLKLHEAIVKVMNKWGISIVDLFNDCPSLNCNNGYKEKYTVGDGTHPNYEGYERFYVPRVYTEIKKLLGI